VSSPTPDPRNSVFVEALLRSLETPEITGAAQGLMSADELRDQLMEQQDDVWMIVDAELARWEQRTAEEQTLRAELIEQFTRPLFSPVGIWERIVAFFTDKTPSAIRNRTTRMLSQNWDYLDASAEVLQAREALITSLTERFLLPAARTVLNQRSSLDNTNSTLEPLDSAGLDQLLPEEFELKSSATSRVDRYLNGMTTASIGIAGPRGAGKTTLLSWYCRPRRASASGGLSLLVTAPVKYEARDYLLYILIVLCRSIIATSGKARLLARRRAREDPQSTWMRGTILRVLVTGLGVAGCFVALLFFADRVLPSVILPPTIALAPNLVITIPGTLTAALPLIAYTLITWLILAVFRRRVVDPLLLAIRVGMPLYRSIALRASRATALLEIAIAAGFVLVSYRAYRGEPLPTQEQLISLAAALLAVVGIYVFGRQSKLDGFDTRSDDMFRVRRLYGGSNLSEVDPVVLEAVRKLDRAEYQQQLSSSAADKYGISASFGISVSAETTLTAGETRTAVAWTRPELVHEIRDLLGSYAASHGRVVVGIDELDKIATRAEASTFIDDIKGIFGVPRCYFLVSVSEDALSDFERRGLPLRTAFDSAFDEVISVDYLTIDESRDLLRTRLIGLPLRFIALCHALSGGLPRDLLRVARRLFELDLPISLADAANELVTEELARKSRLLAGGLAAVSLQPWTKPIIAWTDSVQNRSGSTALTWAAEQLATHIREGGEAVAAAGDVDDKSALRLSIEFGVFSYLCATVVEVCCATDSGRLASEPATVINALDGLAAARQGLAAHPELARVRVDEVRRRIGWPTPGE
jgi:hypothetical protein